jgi:hypothetical protein
MTPVLVGLRLLNFVCYVIWCASMFVIICINCLFFDLRLLVTPFIMYLQIYLNISCISSCNLAVTLRSSLIIRDKKIKKRNYDFNVQVYCRRVANWSFEI